MVTIASFEEEDAMVVLLARAVGIGIETADMLVREVLSRHLRDRRAVARYAGLLLRSSSRQHEADWRVRHEQDRALRVSAQSWPPLAVPARAALEIRRGGARKPTLKAKKN